MEGKFHDENPEKQFGARFQLSFTQCAGSDYIVQSFRYGVLDALTSSSFQSLEMKPKVVGSRVYTLSR